MLTAILIAIFSISAFYCIVCFLIANGFAMPDRTPVSTLPEVAYEDVSFYSQPDKVLLKGWYIPADSNETIIAMHGGKQNRSQPGIDLIGLCQVLNKRGYNILTFDRRGCGESEAPKLHLRSCLDRDFAGAVDYTRSRKGSKENIYLWGTSIGAVAAISHTAKASGIKAVVADSCFADIAEMVSRLLKITFPAFVVFKPGSIYMGRRFFGMEKERPIDNARRISCPIFFINGTEDPAIPESDAYRLAAACKNPASKEWITNGAEHSKSYIAYPEEYVAKVVSFLKMDENK